MDAVSSSSLLRRPGLPEDFVRGSTRNHPFVPGGFDLANAVDGGVLQPLPRGATDGTWLKELAQGGDFQEVAPGLPRGLHFAAAPRVKEAPRHETGGMPPPDLQPVVHSAEVTKVQVGRHGLFAFKICSITGAIYSGHTTYSGLCCINKAMRGLCAMLGSKLLGASMVIFVFEMSWLERKGKKASATPLKAGLLEYLSIIFWAFAGVGSARQGIVSFCQAADSHVANSKSLV
jgi:hypothetical protein